MDGCYVLRVGENFKPEPVEPIMTSIFKQYERVLIESLITSFGLDFIVKDQHGGSVDTIFNVRQIGKDGRMTYKNTLNQQAYENSVPYDKSVAAEYRSDLRFKLKGAKVKKEKVAGDLIDAYTGERISRNANVDIDHVKSIKEIHEDSGRILAEISGLHLANSDENLQATDRSINRSKKEKSVDEYCKWLEKTHPERSAELAKLRGKETLTDEDRKRLHKYEQLALVKQEEMKRCDARARKSYEAKLAKAYYTSPKFAKDLALAAGNTSVCMGARQALGFVFAEVWFTVKEEFKKNENKRSFDLRNFLTALGNGLQRGFKNAEKKYKELFSRFLDGAISGALSSLTTTLCNIFFTTAKNVVRIIRQSYASLVEAAKVLFINPQNYAFGERMRAVVKIIATGASIVVGVFARDAVDKPPINTIPVIKDIVPEFCGAFVTGILSCTLLYVLDKNESINKLVRVLDDIPTIEKEIDYYRRQANYFEQYAAQIMNIDLNTFKNETALYNSVAANIVNAKTESELRKILMNAIQTLGITIPWEGHEDFNTFMQAKNTCLVFR